MLDEDMDPPLPFERQAPSGRRVAVIGSGPGRDERRLLPAARRPRGDRLRARRGTRRHAPLRHPAVPAAQGRGARGRVRGGLAPGRQARVQQGAGPRLHARRPPEPGVRLRSSSRSAATTRTSWASPTRTPTASSTASTTCARRRSACPIPGHAGQRVVVIGGGFTSMDCSRTSVRQGAERGHPRLPPRHEGHAGVGRGPRGDRGGCHRHLPGRPDPRAHRRDDRQGHGRRVHPDAARRARRLRPAAARAGPRHGVHDPLRSGPARHRPGPGPRLDRARHRGRQRHPQPAAGTPTP